MSFRTYLGIAASAALSAGLLTGGVVLAAGSMEAACQARGDIDAATCSCVQGVADKHMDGEDQALAASLVQREKTVMQIMAERGEDGAQSFLEKFAAFGQESGDTCGFPKG